MGEPALGSVDPAAPGPTSRLAVGGLANAVGQAQDLTVTAQDAFGNTTPAYRGTVHVEGDGPPAAWVLDVPLYPGWNRFDGFTLPGDYAFTASDAGVHTFAGGATIIFAGAQTVTATDTTTATITGSQAVTMSPGPMAGFDVLAPVLSTSHRVHIADAQVPKQRLTVAAFDQYGNVATSFNGTLAMSYSFSTIGSTPGDLPATLTLVDGTASSDVTWPTQTDGDITVNMRGKYGTGPLPPPKTFTREVAIASDRPALNAVVITLPPANPGDAPTYQLTIPDQNLVVDGSLTVTTIYPPATVGASIPIDLSGTTITGDSIIVHTTISDPVVNGSGLIVDASTQAGATGTNLVNTATGQTVLQTGTELTVTGDPDAPTFGAVAIIYPGSLFLSTGTNQESQTMVAFSVAPPTCPAGSTWSPNLGKCV